MTEKSETTNLKLKLLVPTTNLKLKLLVPTTNLKLKLLVTRIMLETAIATKRNTNYQGEGYMPNDEWFEVHGQMVDLATQVLNAKN